MSSNTIVSVLILLFYLVACAGMAAGFAILWQIRNNGWKLAEPAVIQSRWRMLRPWMLVGAVIGLLMGMAVVVLQHSPLPSSPATPEAMTSPPPVQSKPPGVKPPAD
uniref:Uncharacterized protein n=1 Tax=Schlesneria paludicola TaxID=360056 RepID=A0A7C2PIH4_9PLAN